MLCGTNNISQNQSHETLLWIWIMLRGYYAKGQELSYILECVINAIILSVYWELSQSVSCEDHKYMETIWDNHFDPHMLNYNVMTSNLSCDIDTTYYF